MLEISFQSQSLNVAWRGPLSPFLHRSLSGAIQAFTSHQSTNNRGKGVLTMDGRDETETNGKEISVLRHTTKCHEMYFSVPGLKVIPRSTLYLIIMTPIPRGVMIPVLDQESNFKSFGDSGSGFWSSKEWNHTPLLQMSPNIRRALCSSESLQQRLTRSHSQNSQLIFFFFFQGAFPFWLYSRVWHSRSWALGSISPHDSVKEPFKKPVGAHHQCWFTSVKHKQKLRIYSLSYICS